MMLAATMPQQMDDRAALRRVARKGDPEAFAVLTSRYQSMVLATCMRALGNESDAEDAAQETFLRLASQAGKIRSNAAAWLHACALGVSIDLVRRRSAQRRAEQRAASANAGQADADLVGSALLWKEVEQHVDRALAALADSDRELIVARYLAGRPQAELAREAGVSEGTLSRRLQRALGRLRVELRGAGLTALSVGALTGALGHAIGPKASAEMSAALGKVGLAGLSKAPTMPSGKLVGAGLAVGLTGVLAWSIGTASIGAGRSESGAGAVAGIAGSSELGPKRPRRGIGPFQVISATDDRFQDRGVWISDKRISIRHGYTDEGESKVAQLAILRTRAIDDIKSTKDRTEVASMDVRLESISPIDDPYHRFMETRRFTITCSFDEYGRIVLEDRDGDVQLGRNEPRWYGVRPPLGWPESGRVPQSPGEFGVLGPWTESERIPVTIRSDEILFGNSTWNAGRYRIIEWERVEGYSRVLAVQAGGRDPRLIGTRFRLLIRTEPESQGGGYSIAYFPPDASRAETRWPSGFEVSRKNPVVVVTIREDG